MCITMKHIIGSILALIFLIAIVNGQRRPKFRQCGPIKEDQFFYNDIVAVPNEHPYMANIIYQNQSESVVRKLPAEMCQGVLITARHLLAPAFCFIQFDNEADVYAVRLGLWNKTSTPDQVNCRRGGYCVLPPQEIAVSEIAIHPDYDPLTLRHNLAVLTMAHDAEISDLVTPVCMPTRDSANYSLVGELFMVTGFIANSHLRSKSWVKTISRPWCEHAHTGIQQSSAHICGYQTDRAFFYPGAALVGVQVVNELPANFYLVGLQVDTGYGGNSNIVSSFMQIHPYLQWIRRQTHPRNT